MNTCLEFVITNNHIERNCNIVKNKIEKIRKIKQKLMSRVYKIKSYHMLRDHIINGIMYENRMLASILSVNDGST